jgi:hypothetical protein
MIGIRRISTAPLLLSHLLAKFMRWWRVGLDANSVRL